MIAILRSILCSPGRLLALIGRNGALVALAAVSLGLAAPQAGDALKPWLAPASGLAVFGAFLSVMYSVERSWLERHVLPVVLWTIAAPCLILGLAAGHAGVESGLLIGIILGAVSPPSSGVPSFAALLRLSPKLALVTYACVSAAAPLAMPALAGLFGVALQLDPLDLGMKLTAIIGGGGACALIVKRLLPYLRWLFPDQAAATGSSALGLLVLYVVSGAVMRQQLDLGGAEVVRLVGIAITVYLVMVLVGTLVFAWLGAQDALTVGLLSGARNVTLSWAAAAASLPPAAEAYIAACSTLNALMPITLQLATRLGAALRRRPGLAPVEIAWYEASRPELTQSALLEVGRTYRIGRSIESDIRLPGDTISRRHALIEILPSGAAVVKDLGSTNGIVKNGERRDEARLASGETVQIGGYVLCVGQPRPSVAFVQWYDRDLPEEVHSLGLAARSVISIGRHPDADIVLPDRTVSSMHANISVDGAGVATVTDAGSTNGVRYKGERVQSKVMGEADTVRIGVYRIRILSPAAMARGHRPSPAGDTTIMQI